MFNGTFGSRDNTLSYEITETGCGKTRMIYIM